MALETKDITKIFTQKQIQMLLDALNMAQKSYDRRIAAESDLDAQGVWQSKLDQVNILASKIRLTEPAK